MSPQILISHVRDERLRAPLLFSIVGHSLLFGLTLTAANFCTPSIIEIGSGEGGGRGGDVITVGLSGELTGGTGMVKPAIVPRPQALPPVPVPEEPVETPSQAAPEETVFEEVAPVEKAPLPIPPEERNRPPAPPKTFEPAPGVIRQQPEPGSGGPGGRPSGSGGGFGGGVGVKLGTGTSGAGLDSWYVRQLEKRIGENWLRTTLGQMSLQVRTTISFGIGRGGLIEDIQIEESSGIRSVDLAAERAVRASSPLPPLPLELRRRSFRFVAHFEYPPR
jgi:TonB family protein